MLDPNIFTIRIGGLEWSLRWYAVLIISAILFGMWISTRELRRRGGDPDWLWDGLTWALPTALVGSRLWYVAAAILGGDGRYVQDPFTILHFREGGLHFYGAMLFGGLAVYVFTRRRRLDLRLILDSVAPALLFGQAAARPANLINQELYGPPTDLPWGISIAAPYRIPPWTDLSLYPVDQTRFHPTFAYEMAWNVLAGGLLLWIGRRYSSRLRPGALFAGWMILAGVGRFWVESFRPDQPVVPGTALSYSRIASALMAALGAAVLLVIYGALRLPFLSPGPPSYVLPEPEGESNAAEPDP
jgi:phosphatidylglycerol:prolipoprotein diacylglycerol transferase